MAFLRPTLTQIIDRIEGDIKSGLGLTTILRRSFEKVFSKAFAAAVHTLYGSIDFSFKQLFVDTAEEEFAERWAAIWGLTKNPAVFAELTIDVTGTTGGTLPADTVYQRSDGFLYKVKTEVTVPAATTVPATIVASDESQDNNGAGVQGNMDNGDTVSLTSPIAGIETDGTVAATTVEGEDKETIEQLRIRTLERIQQPPSGGTATDYIAFAKTVTGVTRVWVLPNNQGEGTVGVTFVQDNDVDIFPDAAEITAVQTAVDARKPITADVTVFAPTEFEMSPTISLKTNDGPTQANVIAELEDLILREAQVRGGVDPKQVGLNVEFDGKITLSKINEAISIAGGEEDHVLVTPTADVQPPRGGLVTLGTVTFQTLP